jgi:hypothetical protein
MRIALAALTLIALALPLHAQGYDGYGSLSGKITFDGNPPKVENFIKRMMEHADKACCLDPKAKDIEKVDMTWIVDPKTKAVANVMVWVTSPDKKTPLPVADALKKRTDSVILDQPHCQFLPRIAAYQPVYNDNGKKVETGHKLIFRNSSAVNHNVRVIGNGVDNDGFNVNVLAGKDYSLPPAKELKPQRLPLPVQCDIHTWMRANLFVFDHPYYAITNEKGEFTIPLVPAGAQVNVMAWHEGVGYVLTNKGAAKTIEKGKTTTFDFKVSAAGN